MSVLESRDYQAARERITGNPIISMMAAGVVTVPLAELAHQDGTPRSRLQPYPPAAHRHLGLIAEAVLAERTAMREAVASTMAPPGTDPESAEVTRIIERLRAAESAVASARQTGAIARPGPRPAPAAQSRPARGRNHPMTAGKTVRPPAGTARADKASGAAGTGSANVGSSRSAGLTSLRQKSSNSDSGTCARPPVSRLRSRQPSQHGANARDHAMSRLRLPGLRRSRSPSWHLARRRCWCTTAAGVRYCPRSQSGAIATAPGHAATPTAFSRACRKRHSADMGFVEATS